MLGITVEIDGWGRIVVKADATMSQAWVSSEVKAYLIDRYGVGHRGLINMGTSDGVTTYKEVD